MGRPPGSGRGRKRKLEGEGDKGALFVTNLFAAERVHLLLRIRVLLCGCSAAVIGAVPLRLLPEGYLQRRPHPLRHLQGVCGVCCVRARGVCANYERAIQDFDLCLECFSVGVEIKEHKNDHDYKIMDYMSFPLFEEGWGADEELLLLEAIQMYAFSIHDCMPPPPPPPLLYGRS